MKKLIMLLILMVTLIGVSYGTPGVKSWKLVWTANIETDLAGYYIYWRSSTQSFDNTRRVDAGKVIQYSLTTTPTNNYLTVSAYDTSGNEGAYADAIFFDKDMAAPAKVGGLSIVGD